MSAADTGLVLLQGVPSVSLGLALVPRPTLRQVKHAEGQHYMTKVDGVWTCECGETRNAQGGRR